MRKVLIPFLLICIAFSCDKKDDISAEQPKDMSGVYIASDEDVSNYYFASLWKNGVPASYSNGMSFAIISSIFVSDKSVYAVGMEMTTNLSVASNLIVWKDGVATKTPAVSRSRYWSVFVAGDDVFIAGTEDKGGYTTATLWKNGTGTVIAGSSSSSAEAYGVSVHNGNVYVIGKQFAVDKQLNVARVWKNGVPTDLTTVEGSAMDIQTTSGGDVYIFGSKQNDQVVWKNGTQHLLIQRAAPDYFGAHAMFVSGTDVYLAGSKNIDNNTRRVPIFWKNQQVNILPSTASFGNAMDIFVKDGDVYVVGHERNGGGNAKGILWKNGQSTILTDTMKSMVLRHIFVK